MSATSDPAPRANRTLWQQGQRLWRDLAQLKQDFWTGMAATGLAATVGLLLPMRAQILFTEVFPDRDVLRLAKELGLLVLIAGVSIGLSGLRRFVMERLCLRLMARMRHDLFAHLLDLPPRALQEAEGGQILSAFTSDMQLFHDCIKMLLTVVLPSAVFMLVYATAMVWFSWQLSLSLIVVVLPLVLATNFFARRIHDTSYQAQRRFGGLLGDINDTLAGLREIKLFAMQGRMQHQFDLMNRDALASMVDRERLAALHPFVVSVCVALGLAIIILFSVTLANAGWVTAGDLTGFVVCLGLAYPPIQEFSHSLGQLAQLVSARDRLDRVTDIPVETGVPSHGAPVPKDAGIRFEAVDFSYGPGDFALLGITLAVAPGERVAVVGPSGAGKSTLIELLPRFHDPASGTISIGGVALQAMPLQMLRQQIGLVPQVPFVFRASLLDNLRAGAPDTPHDKVIEVAQKARVDEFAAHLPQGYDTLIEPGGTNLSVGQRQRIAIARVLLKNPPILLLDEPTSALDAASERLVNEAIRSASHNRTTIIVAHRLSTVRDADRIVVVENGRIVEMGTHDTLMTSDGLYAALFRHGARETAD